MHKTKVKSRLHSVQTAWGRVKYPIGYTVFLGALAYGLWNAPDELWTLDLFWLLRGLVVVLVMFFLQQAQIGMFLRLHGIRPDWQYPALFNARRGILNTLLPAKSGTLLLLKGFTGRYGIGWNSFLIFFLVAGLISVIVSTIAFAWLLWPWVFGATLLTASTAVGVTLRWYSRFPYAKAIPRLFILAVGLFLANTALLYCVLHGLGFGVSWAEVAYLAVVLNVLAQISITPGNLGVREIAIGVLAPHIGIPIAVGILASTLIVILRLGLYGVLWGVLEWLDRTHGPKTPQVPS